MAKASEHTYEGFDPASDLISEKGCDTLLLYLPGFKKERLKVQLTASGILRISGENPVGDNKWRRFHKEFKIPTNCDTKAITAKFEDGILHIRQPKLITSASAEQQKDKGIPAAEPPRPQPQQLTPPPQPQPQPQQLTPPPQPQPQQLTPSPQPQQKSPAEYPEKERDVPRMVSAEEEKIAEQEERKEIPHNDEERKDKWEIGERVKQVVGGSGLFKEMMKPENVKRQIIPAIGVLVLGFYIAYLFDSLTRDEE